MGGYNEQDAITVRQAASAMGVSTQRVYALIRSGKLTAFEAPKGKTLNLNDVLDYMESEKSKGGRPRHEQSKNVQRLVASINQEEANNER